MLDQKNLISKHQLHLSCQFDPQSSLTSVYVKKFYFFSLLLTKFIIKLNTLMHLSIKFSKINISLKFEVKNGQRK